MGAIICEKHGRSPIVHVCMHIQGQLIGGIFPADYSRYQFAGQGSDFGPRYICQQCTLNFVGEHADTLELETPDGEYLWNTAKYAWCKLCFSEDETAK